MNRYKRVGADESIFQHGGRGVRERGKGIWGTEEGGGSESSGGGVGVENSEKSRGLLGMSQGG